MKLFLGIFFLSLALPISVYACICTMPMSDAEEKESAYKRWEYIATIFAIKNPPQEKEGPSYKAFVLNNHKGNLPIFFNLKSLGGSCGYDLEDKKLISTLAISKNKVTNEYGLVNRCTQETMAVVFEDEQKNIKIILLIILAAILTFIITLGIYVAPKIRKRIR